MKILLVTGQPDGTDQNIPLPKSNATIVLHEQEIEWIEAADYYATIHARGRQHLIRESLGSLESRLDAKRFIRVHRSAIVNMDLVQELKAINGRSFVVLQNSERVPVSRRQRPKLISSLGRK